MEQHSKWAFQELSRVNVVILTTNKNSLSLHLEIVRRNNRFYGAVPNYLLNFEQKFKYNYELVGYGKLGDYNPMTKQWSGNYGMLQRGEVQMLSGVIQRHLHYQHFDFGFEYSRQGVTYCSRRDFPSLTIFNVINAFSPGVWAGFCCSLFSFSLAFIFTHWVYSRLPYRQLTLKPVRLYVDFFIRSIASITEPDAIPWFKSQSPFSQGRILTMIWAIFATFLIAFYNSNLRAHLIYSEREPNMRSVKDVLEMGGTLYVQNAAEVLQ